MSFPYKTVLVIGATSGIGLALAEKIIANGSHVIAVGRRKDRLDSLVHQHGPDKVSALQFDITCLDLIPSFASTILKTHPTLDSVILNAGIQRPLSFSSPLTIDLNAIDAELTTNYTSTIHILKFLLPHLLSSPSNQKSLIFISSALALIPVPKVAGYCASKAALHHLVMCVREQVREKGVKVVEIFPPAVKTGLHDYEGGERGVGMGLGEFVEEAWEGVLGGREDVAVGGAKNIYGGFEERRGEMFRGLMEGMRERRGE